MTGQVKEELLTRLAELGVRVTGGAVRFDPALLRASEFVDTPLPFRYLDVNGQWQELTVPASGLAFTWCQVPLVYRLDDTATPALSVTLDSGDRKTLDDLSLPAGMAGELFRRSGKIRQIELVLTRHQLSDTVAASLRVPH